MGKTKDLFKNIRDMKGTLHAKMGSIKDINGMDLTEAEDIKMRWKEYIEKLYRKDIHTIVIIWFMKIFCVQFFCVFLPPLLNIFCFC